jgi:hypothetical protein
MQDKIVDPFAKDFRSKMLNKLTEIRKLSTLQRAPPSHGSIPDRGHLAIFNSQFGARGQLSVSGETYGEQARRLHGGNDPRPAIRQS